MKRITLTLAAILLATPATAQSWPSSQSWGGLGSPSAYGEALANDYATATMFAEQRRQFSEMQEQQRQIDQQRQDMENQLSAIRSQQYQLANPYGTPRYP